MLLLRRIADLLVIVAIAAGLLAIAWRLSIRQATMPSPVSPFAQDWSSFGSETSIPELQLLVPIERTGMTLSREVVPGDATKGIEHLEQRCREVLTADPAWVLPLEVTVEENQLLESVADAIPVEEATGGTALYPLTQPTARIGVREPVGGGAATGRRLLCWGFLVAEGTDQQTVWFARPRQSLR